MLRQWHDVTTTKMYLTGGIGSRHYGEAIGDPYELPPDRAYCETCAAIASIMWNWRMLLVTGESRFADLLERALYNGFLAGLSLDGSVVLLRNPLQSRDGRRAPPLESGCVLPAEHHAAARLAAPLPRYGGGRQRCNCICTRSSAIRVASADRSSWRRDRLPVVGNDHGRGGLEPRHAVDALAAGPVVGSRRRPSTATPSRRAVTPTERAAGRRVTASCSSWTSRRG